MITSRRDTRWPFHIVVMGVSGAGKTTLGERLARRLGCPFIDGDEFHSEADRQKMRRGIALTDLDREPWIRRIVEALRDNGNEPKVLACSALRTRHRETIAAAQVVFVYLDATRALLEERLAARRGHFFHPELLDSQLAALEPPDDAILVSASSPTAEQVEQVIGALSAAVPQLPGLPGA